MQLYCSQYLNNPRRFYWRSIRLCSPYLPLSQLAKVLTETFLEGARVVSCGPKWSSSGEQAYWRCLLDRMMVGRTELGNCTIYVPEDSQQPMPAPQWGSLLSLLDGSLTYRCVTLTRTCSKS